MMQLVNSFIAISLRPKDQPLKDEGWGPLIDNPWGSNSLHEYWGARWHQAFRQHFLVLGGYPLQTIMRTIVLYLPLPLPPKARKVWAKGLGNAGLLLGVFLASGILHNCAIYASGPFVDPATGVDHNTDWTLASPSMIYFVTQSAGLVIERLYKAQTGRPVTGWLGTMWVWLWIIGGGQLVCEYICLSRSIPPFVRYFGVVWSD